MLKNLNSSLAHVVEFIDGDYDRVQFVFSQCLQTVLGSQRLQKLHRCLLYFARSLVKEKRFYSNSQSYIKTIRVFLPWHYLQITYMCKNPQRF